MDLDWQEDAECARIDPDLFFPDLGGSTRGAKKICRELCTVREQCLDYALRNQERFGIWGGLNGRELQRLRNQA